MQRWLSISLISGLLLAQEPSPPVLDPARPLEVKPSRDLFDLATLYYNEATEAKDPKKQQQNFRLAAGKFDRFIRAFPKDQKTNEAWYFLALSYRQLKEDKASRQYFEIVATRGDSGKFVSGAALHLASDDYKKEKWQEAAQWFLTLARTADQAKIRHEALYRRFLCFNNLGAEKEIRASLDAILTDPDGPYFEKAKIALARFHQNNKELKKAFTLFTQLADSKSDEVSSESTLQAALCAQALGDNKNSLIWFKKALNHAGLKDWRGQTQFSLMLLYYQEENHQAVIRNFEKGRFKLAPKAHLQRLIMASKSYHRLGHEKELLGLYEEIFRLSPESESGFEAAYRILLHDHSKEDRHFPKKAEQFFTKYADKRPPDKRLATARFLLAEEYYRQEDYLQALRHYQKIPVAFLDIANRPGIRYHQVKCHLALGHNEKSLASMAAFLKDFPENPIASALRLQRAELLTELGRQNEALADFQAVLESSKDDKLKVLLLLRLSAIYQENKNYSEFAAAQQHILTLSGIPKDLKANAHFHLGVEDFRQKNYPAAKEKLRLARKLLPHKLAPKIGPLLVRCAFESEDLLTLETELNLLKKNHPEATPPTPIVRWLGATLSKEGQHQRAWPFLHDSLRDPKDATALIWKLYAQSSLKLGHFTTTLRAAHERLKLETHPYRKAEGLYQKAQAHTGLKQFHEARQAVTDALNLHPKGTLDLDLRLFAGDIDMASTKPQEALRHYVVVESLYAKSKEQKITATQKVISALEAINSPESDRKLTEYRVTLAKLQAP